MAQCRPGPHEGGLCPGQPCSGQDACPLSHISCCLCLSMREGFSPELCGSRLPSISEQVAGKGALLCPYTSYFLTHEMSHFHGEQAASKNLVSK